MNDLISREEAIKEITENADGLEHIGLVLQGQGARAMAGIVESLPSVEPRRGSWIDSGYGVKCSLCEEWYPHAPIARNQLSFCPNCGADMRGEQNG